MEQLAGFEAFPFSHEGERRTVYRRGTGPAVIVMPEVPGVSAEVIRFANYVVDAGFTVFCRICSACSVRKPIQLTACRNWPSSA